MRLIRRFHQNEGGQISFLMVFTSVLLVALIGMVLETSNLTIHKVELQNTADATAISGGVWIARGLNITSAFNVMETQLVGAAMLMNALKTSLCAPTPQIVQAERAAWCACAATWIGCIPCCIPCVITTLQAAVLPGLCNVVSTAAKTLSTCNGSGGLLWLLADALSFLNEAVRWSFYGIAVADANDIARMNGASTGILISGRLFHPTQYGLDDLFLPTEKGTRREFCEAMELGTPPDDSRGGYHYLLGYPKDCESVSRYIPGILRPFLGLRNNYTKGCGPWRSGKSYLDLFTLAVGGLPPVAYPIFERVAQRDKAKMCGGTSPSGQITITTPMSFDQCYAENEEAEWQTIKVETRPFNNPQNSGALFAAIFPPIDPDAINTDNVPNSLDDAENHPDVKDITIIDKFKASCRYIPPPPYPQERSNGIFEYVEEEFVPGDPESGRPDRWIYTLHRTQIVELPKKEQEIDIPPPTGNCNPPDPHVLVTEDDALRYLAIVSMPRRSNLALKDEYLGSLPQSSYAYAQVEIYNRISEDTFTQDWRVRLERATLLEVPIRSFTSSSIIQILDEQLPFLDLEAELNDALTQVFNH